MRNSAEASAPPAAQTAYASPPNAAARRRNRRLVAGGTLVVLVLLAAGALGPLGLWRRIMPSAAASPDIYTVAPLTLNVTLKEEGELRAVNSVDIKCEVQGQTVTIQWIVDESTRVKKGDLLFRLASDEMKDRVETEEMELRRIQAALEEAEQALEITRSENASTIKRADIELGVAELELLRYLEGEYETSRLSIEINIQQTEMDIDRQEDDLKKHYELLGRGFTTQSKIDEMEAALTKSRMLLGKYEKELETFEAYECPKNEMQKHSAVERAREELDRERQRAASRETQAQARLRDQQETYALRQRRFDRLKEQLAKCEITAPADGVVQYGDSGGRFRWGGQRIAVGERVYDGQTLITLPDTSQMMVTTRIHEADRHKISEGLTCLVRVPAAPGHTLVGKLAKIAQFADSENSWWNPELKEHTAEILLEATDAPLSPGDSAHIEILIEEVPDVLAVPVQCVFARGAKRFVFVAHGGSAAPVEVTLGRSTTSMIEITAGLKTSDHVLMAPDESLLAQLPTPGTEGMARPPSGEEHAQPAAQPAGT